LPDFVGVEEVSKVKTYLKELLIFSQPTDPHFQHLAGYGKLVEVKINRGMKS
jgi:hypothetical protein